MEPGHRPRVLPHREPPSRGAAHRRDLAASLVPGDRRRVSPRGRRGDDTVLPAALAALRPALPGPGAHRGPLRRVPRLRPGHGRLRARPRALARGGRSGRPRLRVERLRRGPRGAGERRGRAALPPADAAPPGAGGPRGAAAPRHARGPEPGRAVPGRTPPGRSHERGPRRRLRRRPAPAVQPLDAGPGPARGPHCAVPRDRRGDLGGLLPAHGRAGPPVGASRGRPEPRAGPRVRAAVAASRDRGLPVRVLRRWDGCLPGGLEPGRDGALRRPPHARAGRDRARGRGRANRWPASSPPPRSSPCCWRSATPRRCTASSTRCPSCAAFAPRPATCCSWTPRSPCSRRWGSTRCRGPERAGPGGPSPCWPRSRASRSGCVSRRPTAWRATAGAMPTGPRAFPRSWPRGTGSRCSGWPSSRSGCGDGRAPGRPRGGRWRAPSWWPPTSRPSRRRRSPRNGCGPTA